MKGKEHLFFDKLHTVWISFHIPWCVYMYTISHRYMGSQLNGGVKQICREMLDFVTPIDNMNI